MCLVLNEQNKFVTDDSENRHLTPIESGILELLMENSDRIISSEEIYSRIWQAEPYDCAPVISVHIRHIREKIEKDPSNPQYVKMFRGRGYRFTY